MRAYTVDTFVEFGERRRITISVALSKPAKLIQGDADELAE